MILRSFAEWFEGLNVAVQNALLKDKMVLAGHAYEAGVESALEMSYVLLDPVNDGCRSCEYSDLKWDPDFTNGKWSCKSDYGFIQIAWLHKNEHKSPAEKTDPTPCYKLSKQTELMQKLADKAKKESATEV